MDVLQFQGNGVLQQDLIGTNTHTVYTVPEGKVAKVVANVLESEKKGSSTYGTSGFGSALIDHVYTYPASLNHTAPLAFGTYLHTTGGNDIHAIHQVNIGKTVLYDVRGRSHYGTCRGQIRHKINPMTGRLIRCIPSGYLYSSGGSTDYLGYQYTNDAGHTILLRDYVWDFDTRKGTTEHPLTLSEDVLGVPEVDNAFYLHEGESIEVVNKTLSKAGNAANRLYYAYDFTVYEETL